ncbi:MAG: glycerol-3-phosphate acyltransferase [Oscillospiraceae bacterium]|nr:glycerol-3-phosphate acyltransferase [Oscillospiraceae bacterium]
MVILLAIAIAAGAYFLGGLNGAIITSRLVYREDIRKHGSGNAGLTNFLRTYGGKTVVLVILIDVLKAAGPVIAGGLLANHFLTYGEAADRVIIGQMWAGLFTVFGHSYPCLYGFKGGKGILSAGTIAIIADWRVALIVWGLFFLGVFLTRYVSLGSIMAATAFPAAFWVLGLDLWATLIALVCGAFIDYRHGGNIVRLIKGEERKLSFGKKRGGDDA